MRRMFRSKLAMWNVLIGMIMLLAGAAALGALTYQIHKHMRGAEDSEKCALSILANDQLGRYAKQGREELVNFNCKRQLLEVGLEDVETRGRIDDNKVKAILANEMKQCWDMVGKGKLDPFENMWSNANEKFCLVCSDVVFDEDVIKQAEEQDYDLTGFNYYIASRRLQDTPGSLAQYITGTRMSPEALSILAQTEDHPGTTINVNKRYIVLWRMEKYDPGLNIDVIEMYRLGWDQWDALHTLSQRGFKLIPSVVDAGVHSGAGFGLGVSDVQDTAITESTFQDVYLIPEDSTSIPLRYGDTEIDFCTYMVN